MFQRCRENENILCAITFFENRAMYEVMWKNIVEPGRPQMTIWREGTLLQDT
jgi:hypothetical protein